MKKQPSTRNQAAVLDRLRDLCLAWPGTSEVEAWGHPTFRVKDKIFAAFGVEDGHATIGFKVTPDHQERLIQDPRFEVAPYVGRHGWVRHWADGKLDWDEIRELLLTSYRLIAPKRLVAQLDATSA